MFFGVYKNLLAEKEIVPSRIWNMDETGISVVHKPGKIIATTGAKQISKITCGEKGKTISIQSYVQ